jgi:beta-glucosidase
MLIIKRSSLFVFFMLLFCSTGWAITGHVIDQAGAPVQNAYITYTALDHRLVWTYSDVNGNFVLGAPGVTGIISNGRAALACARLAPKAMGNAIEINPPGKTTTISLYTLAGRMIGSKTFETAANTRYIVRPFAAVAPYAARTVYIVKLQSGGENASLCMIYAGKNGNAGSANYPKGTAAVSLGKTGAASAANQVRAGKTGYAPAFGDFTSYTQNLGDMKITAINIEAKVDSVIQVILNHPQKKNILAGQSIMPPEGSTAAITQFNASVMMYGVNSMMDWNARRDLSNTAQGLAMANTATHLPIPLIITGDLVHGYDYGPVGGVVLPHNIGLGCSFNPKIVEKCFRVSALESKGAGFNFAFSPCTDVARNLKYGRVYESFSEEPAHTAIMTKAAVLGFQGTDVSHPWTNGATAKHFAGAGGTTDGKQFGKANTAPDSILRKIHLAPYQAAIDADVCAVMAAFNSWVDASGKEVPMHGNTELMTNTLKGTMGFKGFIFGDFEAHWYMQGFYTSQLTAYTGTDVRMGLGSIALNAGLDVPLGGGVFSDWDWAPNAVKAYDAGLLTDARLTDLARRVLRIKFRMGLFNGTNYLFTPDLTALINSQLHKDAAREAVRKTLVCLKNTKNALPLLKNAKIHIVGTLADNMGCQCGGWTYGGASTWQGDTKTAIPAGTSIRGAIQKVCPGATYSASAANIPATADIVVVVTGETPYSETQGEDGSQGSNQFAGPLNNVKSSITLANMPEGSLINTVRAATTKPVVAILISGRPMVLGTSLASSDAFVCAWLPGTEGDGVADVLFGDYDFTGKLSFSWPSAAADEPVNYGNWGDVKTAATPQFPYGYGLKLDGTQLPTGMY